MFHVNRLTIHVFGNPLLPFDSLPLKLLPQLKKQFPNIDFVTLDPNENIKPINKQLIIIDTVIGIDKVTLLNDLDKIQLDKIYSLHDFDLGFQLKLLQKIGELEKITILGVPPDIQQQEALKQLINLIKQTLKPINL